MPKDQPNLDSLFASAVEIESAEQRAAFLDKSCGDDLGLREQVEQLLESDRQAGSFLDGPPQELDITILTSDEHSAASHDSGLSPQDADLSAELAQDAAIEIGDFNQSVLRSIGNRLDEVPHISLRDSTAEGDDPITKPTSTEIPIHQPDSRYQLHGEIARGGMGVILKGRDTDLGRDLAIKVLLDSQKDKPEVVRRFVEEAQIGGQLQHPGIVPVYELGQFADRRPFFSMKLVKGETLAKLLSDRKQPETDRGKFVGIFEQVCQTVAYAHSRGVIHRDLKPANIMVGAFGEVQVMDWGLAKVLSDGGVADEKKAHDKQKGLSAIRTLRSALASDSPDAVDTVGTQTQMGSVMGTPAYMPPEQAHGEIDHLDERADVFGLGAILCEILTGKPPYTGDDGAAVFRRASCGNLDDAFERLGTCGADANLITLTKHCLEFEPDARPRDASELAARISGHLESVEIKLHETEKQRAVEAARAEEERKRQHVKLTLVASVLLMFGVGGTGWMYLEKRSSEKRQELVVQKKEERDDAEATRLVEGLLMADTLQVNTIIEDLSEYRQWARDDLQNAFTEAPEHSNAKLHSGLAMLPEDDSLLPFLKERLLTATPLQFEYVRDILEDYKHLLIADYWNVATDTSQEEQRRFQAACVLASYDPDNEHWQDPQLVHSVATHLVGVLPSELLPWRNALRPVKAHLSEPLAQIYRDTSKDTLVRGFATATLGDFLSDDAEGLFNLLADANQKQFELMFSKLSVHQSEAIRLGNLEVAKLPGANASEIEREVLAMRQANAAVMLIRMDAAENVWPLFRHRPDPRLRSYLIHWLSPRGSGPEAIINRYEQEVDVTVRRALLLCLGEFDQSRTPEDRRERLIESLVDVYRSDPDAGLHAAAQWLLRYWGQSQRIAAIDDQLRQKELQSTVDNDRQMNWYMNSQGQTFAIIDAKEFWMGPPVSELGRISDERLHRRRIDRRFAISTTEVTKAQWREFSRTQDDFFWSADQKQMIPYMHTEDSPMLGMTWYEAVQYCDWLSEQEGIPEDQWCYQLNDDGQYGPGMKAKENFWNLSGYRLPTEAEWEFACRAGTNTSRHYGDTVTLLPKYDWFLLNADGHSWPVASLKPNDNGLFDMQGNAYEWCYDFYREYPPASDDPVADTPTTDPVLDIDSRVLRGAAFDARSSGLRCASRSPYRTSSRSSTTGFRLARTHNLVP